MKLYILSMILIYLASCKSKENSELMSDKDSQKSQEIIEVISGLISTGERTGKFETSDRNPKQNGKSHACKVRRIDTARSKFHDSGFFCL